MKKNWLKSYPATVPAEIDVTHYTSIPDLFSATCLRFASAPAFSSHGTTLSYADTEAMSRQFAAWLQSLAGIDKGARIALMLPNILQYPVALLGSLRAGMVVVNVNPMYTPPELEHQLRDSGAQVIVLLDALTPVLRQVIAATGIKHVVTTRMDDLLQRPERVPDEGLPPAATASSTAAWTTLPAALEAGARMAFVAPGLTRDDIAFLQYTGGTTGVSKGAILSHGNLTANLQQADAWLGGNLEYGVEVVITALPLYHIFALTANCLLFIKYGGHNRLIANPRDMPGFVRELAASGFTAITGVNTLFNGLLHTPGFAEIDFSGLKLALGGGAAIQKAVAVKWHHTTGHRLVEGYGLTETSPFVTCNLVAAGYTGAIGVPIPSTEVAIRDDAGADVATGSTGEIYVRGPQVMQGYWKQPEETAKVLAPNGWFRTGDVGVFDDHGVITLTDRKKDMVLVSGFNVYPNEVEAVIAAHPMVFECAVVGVADLQTGEAVKAFVVSTDPALSEQEVIRHCRESLTNYKVPKLVEFLSELPKSNVGKILRRKLRTP